MLGMHDNNNPWLDKEFEAKVFEYMHKRIPDKVFDSHSHTSKTEIPGIGPDLVFSKVVEALEGVVGKGKVKGGLTMGNPKDFATQEDYDDERLFSCENGKNDGFVTGLLVKPEETPEQIEKWLYDFPRIAALKVCWNYGKTNSFESDILDYAPEWMWEVANKHGLVFVIHLSHDSMSLNHPKNIEQIRYLSKKYPQTKIQLAHCAMGHNPYMFRKGIDHITDLDNVYLDLSGIGESMTYAFAFKYFDRKKLFYGSDSYGFAHRVGRCMSLGKGFLGLHTGDSLPFCGHFTEDSSPYRFGGLSTMTEGLLAMFAAGDMVELKDSEWEDIFYNNAADVYYPIIRK